MNKMLSSWKEIAHFFGKGVRTVQRWEKTLDLPIRRPPGAPSNVVLARTSDLEEWMHRSAAAREAVSHEPQEDVLQNAISELEVEVRRIAGVTPQPVEAAAGNSEAQPVERIQQLVAFVRTLDRNADESNMRRVA